MKNNLLIPSIILSVSLLISSCIIGYSLLHAPSNEIVITEPVGNQIQDSALMTDEECAAYLNISVEDLRQTLLQDYQEKKSLGSYPTFKYIPYMELINGERRFNKAALDKYISYKMFGVEF